MPIRVPSPLLRLFAVTTTLLSSVVWAAPPNRVGAIGSVADTPLSHSVSGRARQATDLGQAPLTRPLEAITLHFGRSAAQQTALSQLLADQQNPSSPRYHKWLTPAQFRDQFGLSNADVAKVSSWLTSQGLTVTQSSLTNTFIVARGTVAQAQKAFAVSIHTVSAGGVQHIANVTEPQLPSAIAGVVAGITGLSDFLPKSRAVVRTVSKPEYTSSTGDHYITPGDFNTIYDLKPLLASAINGTGATIAVMGQTAISLSDVAAFRSAAGLAANVPLVSYTPTTLGISTGDLPEAQLDVEWSGAVAPNATIEFIAVDATQGGAFTALTNSIANTTTPAPILSISYGLCEPEVDESFVYSYDQYFQQANAQGQTLIAPGGDSGATDCDFNTTIAADGLAVDFPASSPNATGVGGTMFAEGTGTYWSASNGTDMSSALSYIPETVWNETAVAGILSAGGGGRSIFFGKPSWQTGTGVPADSVRDVPDLALSAAANHDGYLICTSGSCTSGFADASGNLAVYGGTSVGAPTFAGMLALVEQKIGKTGGLGNINPTLYGLAATSAASVYHDITTGTNASTCAVGSPDCPTSTLSQGYTASAGYDLTSGWGSVDGSNLAGLWSTATPTGTSTSTTSQMSIISVSLPSGVAPCGVSSGTLTLNVGVTPYLTTTVTTVPTGTVQLFVDGAAVGSLVALSNGSATLTVNTSSLASGGHQIAVAYSGDATFASSRGNLAPYLSPLGSGAHPTYVPSTIDVVSTTAPDFALTPCLPSLSVAAGSSGSVTMTVTSLNGFSGPVSFTGSVDGSLGATANFSVSPVTLSASGTGTSVFTLDAYYTTATSSLRQGGGAPRSGGGLAHLSHRQMYGTGAGTAALASLLFLVLPRRRRYVGLLALVLSVAAFGAAGCGSGTSTIPASTVPSGPTGTTTNSAAGTYILNITATGANSAGTTLVHTSSLSLTVQ